MKKLTLRKITTCGILTSFAVIAFTLENLFPPLFIPGARMGISNVFILLSALLLGSVYGYATLIVKILLGSIFSGNVSSVLYSLPAGLISLTLELALICWTKKVSIIAGSISGAVVNVTLQNTVFCLVTGASEYLAFLPYLASIGIVSGCIVGFAVYLSIKKVKLPFLRDNNIIQENQSEH